MCHACHVWALRYDCIVICMIHIIIMSPCPSMINGFIVHWHFISWSPKPKEVFFVFFVILMELTIWHFRGRRADLQYGDVQLPPPQIGWKYLPKKKLQNPPSLYEWILKVSQFYAVMQHIVYVIWIIRDNLY